MKPTEETEKRVKKVKLVVNADTNRKVFGDIVQAFDKSKARESAEPPTSVWRTVTKTATAGLAAAAALLIAIGFVIAYRNRDEQVEPPRVVQVAKSPGEMLTAMSLNIAYRKGGLEAVEKQCDRAFKMLGLQPTRISVRQLLEEFNSEEVERKKL